MGSGERIKQRRTELGLSVRKLGEMSGVSGATVSLWENDMTSPSGENLLQLAKALNKPAEWIVSGETKQAIIADDQMFVDFVSQNLNSLDDDDKNDIRELIRLAAKRKSIFDKRR